MQQVVVMNFFAMRFPKLIWFLFNLIFLVKVDAKPMPLTEMKEWEEHNCFIQNYQHALYVVWECMF